MAIVRANDVTCRLDGRDVIESVSFEVDAGSVFGIVGAIGAGKTVLLQLLSGELRPSDGEIEVCGINPHLNHEATWQVVGYLPSELTFPEGCTGIEYLEKCGKSYGLEGKELDQSIQSLVETFNLQLCIERTLESMNLGWQKRLALAGAMIHRPKVVLIDELTIQCDPETACQLWDLVIDLAVEGTTFICTIHYMYEALRCKSLAYLVRGKMITSGSPGELIERYQSENIDQQWISFQCDHTVRAQTLLSKISGVNEISIEGHLLKILIDHKIGSSQIEKVLHEAGICSALQIDTEPSLDDVLRQLTPAKL